jgi:NAD(P)-dependent dehydrogenase (short-subunit alcohol dehydrogenase family)
VNKALVFGGTGTLGAAIVSRLVATGWDVDIAGRREHDGITIDVSIDDWAYRSAKGPYQGVVWAQGMNAAGGVLETTPEVLRELYDANVVFVAHSLQQLVAAGVLATPARGVVLSSVWQLTARAHKLAYVASKAALAGAIPAMAIDMAGHGFAINAVLPGVIDTPMTRTNLSAEQVARVEAETIGGALATPQDVARATCWLLDRQSQGINGQSITVDNGWSSIRHV